MRSLEALTSAPLARPAPTTIESDHGANKAIWLRGDLQKALTDAGVVPDRQNWMMPTGK
jgi:hypothetical protein